MSITKASAQTAVNSGATVAAATIATIVAQASATTMSAAGTNRQQWEENYL
jgi:hypothetical protein